MNPEKPKNIDREALAKSLEDKIEIWHKETDRRLKEIEKKEAYFEKRRKPLPEKLYHITTRQNAQQILREGLDPSKLILEDREVVCLSDDIEFAVGVAQETQKAKRGGLAVLEIDTQYLTPSRVHNYLREADPNNPDPLEAAEIHEVHYESTIPPEAIKIIKPEKKK